jgi:hypothetical protein
VHNVDTTFTCPSSTISNVGGHMLENPELWTLNPKTYLREDIVGIWQLGNPSSLKPAEWIPRGA